MPDYAMAINSKKQPGMTAGMLLSGAVALLALPSAVLAFSSGFEPRVPNAYTTEAIQAARLSARLAPALSIHSLGKGQMFHFTPAGSAGRTDRSVTVAVRVDPLIVQGILAHSARPALAANAPGAIPLQIAPTAFNLGVARGYRSFAQNLVPAGDGRKADTPDLTQLTIAPASKEDPSRFSPRIVLDEKQLTGRAPRTFSGSADQVDVGGSYRLGRNIDVTAGVRYSQERDRLRPLTDGKKDGQAVYVGTQFRF
jgi:hypothetical protein